jgi:hypothetical protein
MRPLRPSEAIWGGERGRESVVSVVIEAEIVACFRRKKPRVAREEKISRTADGARRRERRRRCERDVRSPSPP